MFGTVPPVVICISYFTYIIICEVLCSSVYEEAEVTGIYEEDLTPPAPLSHRRGGW